MSRDPHDAPGKPTESAGRESPAASRRFQNRDGVTEEERRRPHGEGDDLQELERAAAKALPDQLPLFGDAAGHDLVPRPGGLSPLAPSSSLDLARTWYRRDLESKRRSRNTIESYSYDLRILEETIGPKPLTAIDRRDIARFLGEASSRTTRKRRLTSVRRFFRFLIDDAKVLKFDPTDGYYPHTIPLRLPVPLFPDEQEAMLAAAAEDEPWSALSIWLMMRLGLTRGELLALRRDHIDRTSAQSPIVHVVYEDIARASKERRLAGDRTLTDLLDGYLDEHGDVAVLVSVGAPAVNGMVERVREAAGIDKDVTPQTLRHTFAVEMAKAGADRDALLRLLGLVDDARNRASVDRYIRLAAPPLPTATDPGDATGRNPPEDTDVSIP